MKKRLISAFCAALMLLTLFSPPSKAATTVNGQTVIFTIINNDLLELRYDSMPYVTNGVVYVPYTDFSGHFGITSVYNSRDDILVLSTVSNTLFFDMANQKAFDEDYQELDFNGVYYNGQIYIPAKPTCSAFRLLFYYNAESSVIRIKDYNSSYSDRSYINMLMPDMEAMLQTYIEASRETEPEEELKPFYAYLAFRSLDGTTPELIDWLVGRELSAAFFLTREDILANTALVRRLYVEGFTLALDAGDAPFATPEALITAYNDANEALSAVTRSKTRLVAIPGGSNREDFTTDYRAALRDAGYRYWDFTLTAEAGDGVAAEDIYEELRLRSESVAESAVLMLPCAGGTREAVRLFYEYCIDIGCTFLGINELTTPINFMADRW